MKRLINVALAVVLLVGLYGYSNPGFAQDESSSGQEQTGNSGNTTENEGSGETSNQGSGEAVTEGTGESTTEAGSEEKPPEDNKVYTCPKCGYTSDGPGDCPACNVSLTEGSSETSSDSGNTGSDETSETGGDSEAPTGDESGTSDSETSTPPSDTQE